MQLTNEKDGGTRKRFLLEFSNGPKRARWFDAIVISRAKNKTLATTTKAT